MSNFIRVAQVTPVTVHGTATLMLAAALQDRVAVAVRNTDTIATLYLAFSQATATTADGWPILPGEIWAADLRPGVALWGISSASDIDVRILQGAE